MFQNWAQSKRDGSGSYKMYRCGHIIEVSCPAFSFPCPICGEKEVFCMLPEGPRGGYLPRADLTWPGATLTSSVALERFVDMVCLQGCSP